LHAENRRLQQDIDTKEFRINELETKIKGYLAQITILKEELNKEKNISKTYENRIKVLETQNNINDE